MSDLIAPVEVEFELDRTEVARALRWHVVHTSGFRRTAPVGTAAAVLLVAAARFNGWSWTWSIAAGAVALGVAILLVAFVFPRSAAARSPDLTKPHAFRLAPERIGVENVDFSGPVSWESYDRWAKSEEFYFLYYGEDRFTPIPRRALEEDEERRLEELLADRGLRRVA